MFDLVTDIRLMERTGTGVEVVALGEDEVGADVDGIGEPERQFRPCHTALVLMSDRARRLLDAGMESPSLREEFLGSDAMRGCA